MYCNALRATSSAYILTHSLSGRNRKRLLIRAKPSRQTKHTLHHPQPRHRSCARAGRCPYMCAATPRCQHASCVLYVNYKLGQPGLRWRLPYRCSCPDWRPGICNVLPDGVDCKSHRLSVIGAHARAISSMRLRCQPCTWSPAEPAASKAQQLPRATPHCSLLSSSLCRQPYCSFVGLAM